MRRPDLVEALVAPGGTPAGRARLEGSEAMVASDSVVDAFMSMGETDYRGALRSLMTAANPQMTEDEVRERVKAQIEYQPQETAVARLRAWVDDDATDEGREMGDRLWILYDEHMSGGWFPAGEEGSPDLESPFPRGPRRGGGRRHDQPTRSVRKRRAASHLQGALDRLTDMPNLSRPGDVELHFEERGDGPLVVLAPYWSGQPDVYEGFLSDLSRDHRIVTWDARGSGESTHEGPYDLETDSSDLEAVLEHLGAAAVVIAVANGCNAATHVAARRGDLIATVLAFGAGPFSLSDFEGSEAMLSSEGVVTAFLEMLERDYRGALRTVFSSTNAQMSEDELRERISPRSLTARRTRRSHGCAPGPPTTRGRPRGPWWPPADLLLGRSRRDVAPPLSERRGIMARVAPKAQVEESPTRRGHLTARSRRLADTRAGRGRPKVRQSRALPPNWQVPLPLVSLQREAGRSPGVRFRMEVPCGGTG